VVNEFGLDAGDVVGQLAEGDRDAAQLQRLR
jgi:hypothetical protein